LDFLNTNVTIWISWRDFVTSWNLHKILMCLSYYEHVISACVFVKATKYVASFFIKFFKCRLSLKVLSFDDNLIVMMLCMLLM